jgi:hypothetical protein
VPKQETWGRGQKKKKKKKMKKQRFETKEERAGTYAYSGVGSCFTNDR